MKKKAIRYLPCLFKRKKKKTRNEGGSQEGGTGWLAGFVIGYRGDGTNDMQCLPVLYR